MALIDYLKNRDIHGMIFGLISALIYVIVMKIIVRLSGK